MAAPRPGREILEAAFVDARPIAATTGKPAAHCVAQILRRDDAVGTVAAVEQLAQQMSRSAADVEDADFAFGPRQLRDQHVVVALLGDGEVAELELEVRVPKPVVQVFHPEELLREDQPQLPAVHLLHASVEWRFFIRDLNSLSAASSVYGTEAMNRSINSRVSPRVFPASARIRSSSRASLACCS